MSVKFNLNGESVLMNSTGKPGSIGEAASAVAMRAA
jgi:hypothetical protein